MEGNLTTPIPQDDLTTPELQIETPTPQTSNLLYLPLTEPRQSKRTAPSTISTETNVDSFTEKPATQATANEFLAPEDRPKTRSNKKMKKSDSTESLTPLTDQLMPAKKFIEESSPQFILEYDQFLDFLENVQGSNDPLSVACLYTENTTGLIDMMTKIHKVLTQRSIKSRITRTKKKLLEQLAYMEGGDNSEHDTDASQVSSY